MDRQIIVRRVVLVRLRVIFILFYFLFYAQGKKGKFVLFSFFVFFVFSYSRDWSVVFASRDRGLVWSGLRWVIWSRGLRWVIWSRGLRWVIWSRGLLAGSSGLVVSLGHLVSSGLQVPVRLPDTHITHITHTHTSLSFKVRFDASDLYSSLLFDAIDYIYSLDF